MFHFFSKPLKAVPFEDGTAITFGDNKGFTLHTEGHSFSYTTQDKYVFENGHGEKVIEVSGLITDKREDRSWALATFDKGSFSSNHFHKDRTEIYYVTSGIARVIIDGIEHSVKEGESINIQPNQHHQVFNDSDASGLEILVKCTPSWIYQDMNLVETAATSNAPTPGQ